MAEKKKTNEKASNQPTHHVEFRSKRKDGSYGDSVRVGGAWQNSAGGISFPFAGGSITVWPNRED